VKKSGKTMLDRAKAFQTSRGNWGEAPSTEEIELAVAWMMGQVTDSQVKHVLGTKSNGSHIGTMARILRRAAKLGRITLTLKDGR
jgi:hypothetical protein